MVDPQVRPVLALGLEGLERAKRLFVLRLAWHVATLVLLITAATVVTFLHGHDEVLAFVVECIAAVMAIATEFLALRAHHRAVEAHSVGRQVMRRVMLLDARRPEDAVAYLAHVSREFPESVRQAAEKRINDDQKQGPAQHQLSRYYYSQRPPGAERLRDHLLESALFSERLYQTAWRFSAWILSGFVVVAVVVSILMGARGLGPGEHWAEFSIRFLIVLLAFIPASQELDHALLYRMSSERLKELIKRVEQLWDPAIPTPQLDLRLTADVADYGANTTSAPPIRTLVYQRVDSELCRFVQERIESLNKPKTTPHSPPSPGA